jgi:hypothetical protein
MASVGQGAGGCQPNDHGLVSSTNQVTPASAEGATSAPACAGARGVAPSVMTSNGSALWRYVGV